MITKVRVTPPSYTTQVHIDPINFLAEFRADFRRKRDLSPYSYINSDGFWVHWEDTGHGSGLTTKVRQATREEKDVEMYFRDLMVLAEELYGTGEPPCT